jgi:DNA-binding NtrC family response regulator
MVSEERFRADLFYRLNVVHLAIPPIRSRTEDIPLLVEHFLGIYCARNCKYLEAVSREVLEAMMRYPWPGNVRELENCIEKMVVMAPGSELTPDLLPLSVMAYQRSAQPMPVDDQPAAPALSFEEQLKDFIRAETADVEGGEGKDLYNRVRSKWERHLFEVVLDRYSNNKSRAARLLGITRNTLNARLGELSDVKREWKVS